MRSAVAESSRRNRSLPKTPVGLPPKWGKKGVVNIVREGVEEASLQERGALRAVMRYMGVELWSGGL